MVPIRVFCRWFDDVLFFPNILQYECDTDTVTAIISDQWTTKIDLS